MPEALLNFLGLLGFSIGDNREKFTLDEMIAAFDWEKVSAGGPVFDLEKLGWLNGIYIRELSPEGLIQRIRNWRLSDEMLRRLVPLVHERIRRLDDAPIHINAIARHIGVKLTIDDWESVGHKVPLLVNMQPAGHYLGEEYFRAGGLPAVINELMKKGLIHEGAKTINGKTMGENCRSRTVFDHDVIFPIDKPMKEDAGFIILKGNLFDNAVMKLSVISDEFQQRYLNDPKDPDAFEGRAIVFDGPEDYHARIDDPVLNIDEHCLLFVRGTGPIGYPGGAEVVNMQPPAALIKRGIHSLPCIGDGRQSGTSGSPSILNASPEAAAGGGLAILRTGDKVRIDLKKRSANILVSDAEIAERRADLQGHGGYKYPKSQTPWQEIQRSMIEQFDTGMVLKPAVQFQDVAHRSGRLRDNH